VEAFEKIRIRASGKDGGEPKQVTACFYFSTDLL
jgi:hypothetical protein